MMPGFTVDIGEKCYKAIGDAPAKLALSGLAFRMKEDEFVALVGPSGCGKTTLLNIIAGIDRDFVGSIDLADSVAPRIGYVFQTPRLLPWRTAYENITLVLPPGKERAIVNELLREMGLAEARDVYPARLSLGMSRRVAIARAFAVRPGLLLMDEPFASLDEATAERLRRLLLKIWRDRPTAVLFVTHDLREAIRLADRILLLSASPARVAAEIAVTLPRDRRTDATAVNRLRDEIAVRHGRLLAAED